jgi:hypothetical protein
MRTQARRYNVDTIRAFAVRIRKGRSRSFLVARVKFLRTRPAELLQVFCCRRCLGGIGLLGQGEIT